MPAVKSRREEYAEATRRALLDAGAELFSTQGYAATSIEDVVRRARVTRGALYHHFSSKQELFEAVFEELETAAAERVAAVVATAEGDAWETSMAGIEAFLDICMEPLVGEITLRQAPAALGWARWREIEERHAIGLIRFSLDNLMELGVIGRRPVGMLAGIVFAALVEAALSIGTADDQPQARQEAGEAITALLTGLRTPPS